MGQRASADQESSISGESVGASNGALTTTPEAPPKKRYFTGFGVAMLFVLAGAILMYFNFQTVIVRGRSMFDTFKTGDKVIVCKAYWMVGPIKDDDVVVLDDSTDPANKDGYIIKRVYKMEGEVVDWKYVPNNYDLAKGDFVVPKGQIYVLGDNRPESTDSRVFGTRPINTVIGKVLSVGRKKHITE